MACRASVACSWSTSRRMVLSLWTISGPSFTLRKPSRMQFLCSFYVDDPVDGQAPVRSPCRDRRPCTRPPVHGYRNNGLAAGIPEAVHHVHGDPLLEPDRFPQRLQPQLGGFLAAAGTAAGRCRRWRLAAAARGCAARRAGRRCRPPAGPCAGRCTPGGRSLDTGAAAAQPDDGGSRCSSTAGERPSPRSTRAVCRGRGV